MPAPNGRDLLELPWLRASQPTHRRCQSGSTLPRPAKPSERGELVDGRLTLQPTAFGEGLAAARIAFGFLPLFLNDFGLDHPERFVRIRTAPFQRLFARSLRNNGKNANAFFARTPPSRQGLASACCALHRRGCSRAMGSSATESSCRCVTNVVGPPAARDFGAASPTGYAATRRLALPVARRPARARACRDRSRGRPPSDLQQRRADRRRRKPLRALASCSTERR